MEANTPNKIYVHLSRFWGLTANKDNITKNGIEYTRTDSFIDKVCEYISQHQCEYIDLEDFKSFMKEE